MEKLKKLYQKYLDEEIEKDVVEEIIEDILDKSFLVFSGEECNFVMVTLEYGEVILSHVNWKGYFSVPIEHFFESADIVIPCRLYDMLEV